MNLPSIPIHKPDDVHTVGNLRALLAEISALLENLLSSGKTGMIDINGLPLAPGEYEELREMLGQGEVSVRIDAIGPSEIIETHYPGVWWVTHYNVEGDIISDMLDIAPVPDIVKSQPEDMRAGLARLRTQLGEVAE